ncbi:DUF6597 domain-containing transcriptional factor [Larkinella insperata]|uniref:DUF6597 domain-containing transcriptional factor n=1 Tax=Larkinella insperata TaxID=332158 RepID=A0ABW3Q6Z7_9BACT|nr:helix-turn-helix domain-containing protein [Larkinella insperata]
MFVNDIEYKFIQPPAFLAEFVESYWMLVNHSEEEKAVVLVPDGRVDVFFSYSSAEPFHTTVAGVEREASSASIRPRTVIFAVSFKLLAVEYILDTTVSVNEVRYLPAGFWGITADDLADFGRFCQTISDILKGLADKAMDGRKVKLFELIYGSNGSLPIRELAERAAWSSRQINRYFNQRFGISLKAYCDILRFRASFQDIRAGKLFPEQNFTDQAHFIRDVRKFSGVTPKGLRKNQNDRFIQFSTLEKR